MKNKQLPLFWCNLRQHVTNINNKNILTRLKILLLKNIGLTPSTLEEVKLYFKDCLCDCKNRNKIFVLVSINKTKYFKIMQILQNYFIALTLVLLLFLFALKYFLYDILEQVISTFDEVQSRK